MTELDFNNLDPVKILKATFKITDNSPGFVKKGKLFPLIMVWTGIHIDRGIDEEESYGKPFLGDYPLIESRSNKNLYYIEKEESGGYRVVTEGIDGFQHLNSFEAFLKIIKDTPIIRIELDTTGKFDADILFDCTGRKCLESRRWAKRTILNSPQYEEYVKYTTSPEYKYHRGDFYKDPITGREISQEEKLKVDEMFKKLYPNLFTSFGKSSSKRGTTEKKSAKSYVSSDIKYLHSI